MMIYHQRRIFLLCLVFAMYGCTHSPINPVPSESVNSLTSTPELSLVQSTDTPNPENSPTIIAPVPQTLTLTPELDLNPGWFLIPKLTHPKTVDFSIARSFNGLKIPPIPEQLVVEFYTGQPYGEVPPDTIFYQLYLIRKGNMRMLWLGIPFKETVDCCGLNTPHRIYDSIPFPAIETDSLLIPFICTKNHQLDLFLIVVAEPPKKGESATNIRYAWRIDPEGTSLKSTSTQGIECSRNW